MADTRITSLRTMVLTVTVAITGVALLVAAALFVLTSWQRSNAATITSAVRGVHVGQEMELALLTHARAHDGVVRAQLEGQIRYGLEAGKAHVGSADEERRLRAAAEALDRYFAGTGSLESAFGALESLVGSNLAQTEEASAAIARSDRLANALAVALSGAVLALAAGLAVFLRRALIAPVGSLAGALERFASGERDARVSASGPREIRELGSRFNELAEAVARQQAAQLTFLAGAAHDLRTPVSTLRLSLATLGHQPPERSRQMIRIAQHQIDRLERMLGDLTDATRIEAGQLELKGGAADLCEIARETVALFSSADDRHVLALEAPPEPVVVHGDALRLEQVATNLVSNALKYSPEGGAVTVSVATEDGVAVLRVEDEGVGIAADELPRLFEPFRRVGSLREHVPGVGLGLSVSRRIVDAHGGTIEVESQVGRGTRVTVRLPRREAARH